MRLRSTHYGACDAIITNPPYTRDADAQADRRTSSALRRPGCYWTTDWAATLQAAPYLPHCSDIVTIGRVKWIEGSKHTGKDNHAWYRFDARHKGGPVFHGRGQGEDDPLHGAPESASNAASVTSRSDPVRGSVRRRAGSAPIARGLA